MEETVACWW